MNDVPAAPPADTPAHEVPVNESPVTTPTPIGNQAPDKPGIGPDYQRQSGRPPSRREAIQEAFNRAAKEQPKPEKRTSEPAKPAAKPAKAEPAEEKLDLKKRPSDQPRGERGQFAPRQQAANPDAAQAAPDAPKAQIAERPDAVPRKELPPHAPYRDPPPRFAQHAQAEWANAPESVRGEVYRMHQEFGQAHQQYRADNEAMNEIREFDQLARQTGTTLKAALTNYVGIEQKLRSDLIGGLDQIVNNLGLIDPKSGKRITLYDVAYHVASRTPEQLRQTQQGNAQVAASQQIGALQQEIAGLRNQFAQMHNQQQFTYTRAQVDQFADQHPRFDELGDIIQAEVQSGYSLEDAYRRAELLRPSTHAAQTRTQSAQTRDSDRSISGAPEAAPASTPGSKRRSEKPVGRREAIGNAIRRVNGSL